MSYQPQDPNNPSQYGGYSGGNPQQTNPSDPYSGQQPGGYQQPGYQQPGYQQPGYQQPPYGQQGQQQYNYQAGAASSGPSTMNMQPNVAAGLSVVFGWISGLVFFLLEKQNRFVRFYAMQSIIFFGGLTVLSIIISILANIASPIGYLSYLLNIVGFIGWLLLVINSFQGKYFKLPYVGDYAEKYANQSTM